MTIEQRLDRLKQLRAAATVGWKNCRIKFLTGCLVGMETIDRLPPESAVEGKVVKACIGSSSYQVLEVLR
jgi:hypothetical protein